MEAPPEKKASSGTFGPKLRQERQRHHLSQEKLAEMVGCDVRSIRRWEQGKSIPDYENRHRLSKALDITLEHFHQLLQPSEEKDEEPLENNTVVLNNIPLLPPISDKNGKDPLDSNIQVSEDLSGSNHSTSMENKGSLPYLAQQHHRRTLLKWGGTGLVSTLIGGGGLFYWFTRSSSISQQASSSQVYKFSAQHGAGIRDVEWSPLHDFIVCVDEENVAQVITVDSNTTTPPQLDAGNKNSLTPTIPAYSYNQTKIGTAVNCVAWSPDGTQLASPSIDNMIHIWSPQSGVDTPFPYDFVTPQSIAWSNDGQKIAVCGADGMVGIWNVTSQHGQMYRGHTGTVWRVAWSSNSIYLASAGADNTVRIWNTTQKEELPIYTGHQQAVFDVKWPPSDDVTRIISASADKTVQIWNPMTGLLERAYTQHHQAVQTAEWSSDGQYIASAGVDKTIRVWDALTGNTYKTYSGHANTIWALSWASYGMDLASASEDGTMRVWNVSI